MIGGGLDWYILLYGGCQTVQLRQTMYLSLNLSVSVVAIE